MDKEKLTKLKELLKMVDESITRKEFVNAFGNVVKSIKKTEEKLELKIDNKTSSAQNTLKELQELHKTIIDKIEKENEIGLSNIKKWTIERINTLFIKSTINSKVKEIDSKIKEVDKKIDNIKAGKDADEEVIVNKVLEKIELPEYKEVILDDAKKIRKKLETLHGEEELKLTIIDELEKRIKELEERPVGRLGGGGTSDIGVQMSLARIIRKETPVGVIDGANKVYTVTGIINAVFSFAINGQAITDDEYSISGSTITFTTALPAPLSGLSFRIIYV